ncbi:hypothetical protein V6N11_069641 [Hibiscus sabdariffa]|uniref:Uncharacterized protein n=1 Tax=Hibiscus sabdariffa TaxID=183260 RepID=A0ABR2Q3C9_9ROSI
MVVSGSPRKGMMKSQFGLEEHNILYSPLEGHIDNGILDELVSPVINNKKNDGVGATHTGVIVEIRWRQVRLGTEYLAD